MTFFRNFTIPLWEIFSGNLLFLFCSLFYLVWWIIIFRPDSSGSPAGGFFIATAFITGVAAIALMFTGINALSHDSKGLPVIYILGGGAVLFLILLPVTAIAFRRPVTSELIIIHIWAVVELSAISVLYERLGAGRTVTLAVLTGIATITGLICYMLYYRLDKTAGYRNGIIPLATDAVVMTVFQVILAVS